MRKVIAFCIYLSILLSAKAQTAEFDLPKKLPHAVVYLKDQNIFMDQYEVSVGNWFAFVWHLKMGERNDYIDYLPDESLMPAVYMTVFKTYKRILADSTSQNIAEFRPALNLQPFPWNKKKPVYEESLVFSYPITGITYDQVLDYLEWQGEIMLKDKQMKKILGDGFQLKVKLLKLNEWNAIYSDAGLRNIENTTGLPDSVNTHGCYLINVKYDTGCESMESMAEDYGNEVFPVAAFFPDGLGLYDIFGNVAEMVEEEGKAIGGSYFHWAASALKGEVVSYTSAEKWLGFRCVYKIDKK